MATELPNEFVFPFDGKSALLPFICEAGRGNLGRTVLNCFCFYGVFGCGGFDAIERGNSGLIGISSHNRRPESKKDAIF